MIARPMHARRPIGPPIRSPAPVESIALSHEETVELRVSVRDTEAILRASVAHTVARKATVRRFGRSDRCVLVDTIKSA
jgi:hypothetical protein